MNFFTAFDTWLQAQLATFVADRTAALAALIEPFVVTCGVLYVLTWGYLQLTGRIEQPVLEGVRRIVLLAVVFGLALRLWAFNELFVDTFMTSPRAIASAFAAGGAGSAGTMNAADIVLTEGASVAENLLKQGSLWGEGAIVGAMGVVVYLVVMITATYAAFLDVLARIALAVILALGPLFLTGLLFDSTKRFFEAWIAQLANYGLVAILTGAVVGLVLQIVRIEATTVAALGTAVTVAQTVPLVVGCVMVVLVMRQVMPIAASLASGVALASMGVVSLALAWSLGRAGSVGRGLTDSHTSRWDPISRKAGYWLGTPLRGAAHQLAAGGAAAARAGASTLGLRPRNEIRRRSSTP